jgi:PAS domain S-box-containing protein
MSLSPTAELDLLRRRVAELEADRAVAEQQRRMGRELQRLLTAISSDFVNLPDEDTGEGINRALAALGQWAGVDRSFVALFRNQGVLLDVPHEWVAEGRVALGEQFQSFSLERFRWFREEMNKRELVHVPRLEDFPPQAAAERELCQSLGLASLLIVPMARRGRSLGMVGFATECAQKTWDPETILLLRVVGEIFAGALERQWGQQERRASEARLRRIIDSNILGILFWSADRQITDANESLLRLLDYTRADLIARRPRLEDLTPSEFWELDRRAWLEMDRRGACAPYEKKLRRRDGSLVPVLFGGALFDPEASSDGEDQGVGFVLDISERKLAEIATEQSEQRFRILARNVPGVVYLYHHDEPRTMLFLNEAVRDLTGIAAREFLEHRVALAELRHPEDATRTAAEIEAALQSRQPFHLLYRLRHVQGDWRWVEEHGQGVLAPDGRLQYVEGTIFDVTDRKRAEDLLRAAHDELERRVQERTRELQAAIEALQFENAERRRAEAALLAEQALLRQTLEQHESHRRLLSYEIHDGLAQYVTGALMHLESYVRRSVQGELDPHLELGLHLLRKTMQEARRLISGLRPPILDESGLVAAIEYLIREQEPLAERVEFVPRVSFGRLSPLLESALFRIVQEALTNVAKHSHARHVQIELTHQGGELRLLVADDGQGFDPDEIAGRGHGLQGIRERARLLAGRASIESRPGSGTRVVVEVPLK